MGSGILIILLVIFSLVLPTGEVRAFDIQHQWNQIYIVGNIEKGDFNKFESYVSRFGYSASTITIASPGGDLLEAIRIGRLIREMRFSVRVPSGFYPIQEDGSVIIPEIMKDKSNLVCTSSCFYIFVAGVERYGTKIGIHRPYLSSDDYKSMNIDDALEASAQAKKVVSEYMLEMGVPASYIDRSFAIASDEIEWLGRDELNKYFSGYIPEIEEWISAQCPDLTKAEAMLWREGCCTGKSDAEKEIFAVVARKYTQITDCKSQVLKTMSCMAWKKKYERNLCTE